MAKRYWLKLNQGFLDSNEIAILEGEKDGPEYIILWLRLLLLCLGKDEKDCGFLRLNDHVPYTADMISRITKMSKSIVESGIIRFVNLGMMEILEDGTYYIEKVQELIGKESESAERVRKHRANKLLLCNNGNATMLPYINKEVEEEKEVEPAALGASQYLYDRIVININPTTYQKRKPDLNKWAIDIEKLNRIDGIEYMQIRKVIEWATADKFWQGNILSGSKLRKQYTQLESQMKTRGNAPQHKTPEEIEEEKNMRIYGPDRSKVKNV